MREREHYTALGHSPEWTCFTSTPPQRCRELGVRVDLTDASHPDGERKSQPLQSSPLASISGRNNPACRRRIPFLLDYDLVILAIPLAWLFSEARRSGFLSWEKLLILIAFVLPLLSRLVALQFSIPLGPPVLIAVFAAVLRRGLAGSVVAGNRAVGRIALSPGLPGS